MTAAAAQPDTPSRLAALMARPGPRMLGLGVLIVLLLIPLGMIESRVAERGQRRDEAAQSWGHAQQLAGPLLRLPYRVVTQVRENDKTVEQVRSGWLVLPPARLDARAVLDTQVRRRGIFEVPVYRAQLALAGRFDLPDATALPVSVADLDFSRAEVVLGISEPGSLSADSHVEVAGQVLALEPSAPNLGGPGVHARLPSTLQAAQLAGGLGFRIELQLNGSSRFGLAPVARETRLQASSNWPHPGFTGQGLPVQSRITDGGFSAEWSRSHLGRGYPAVWLDGEVTREQIEASTFGLELCVPVDPYRMAERIAKYASLLILLSFAAVWVMELLGGRPLHAVQYLLLGASLCLFGLLQLALAEHLGFDAAFALAACAVIAQAGFYARNATGDARRAGLLALLLGGWFAYLYAVLQAEDLAFLLGAIALFVALSGVMWATRKVNWATGERWDVADATLE
jgi:inner membrane protein